MSFKYFRPWEDGWKASTSHMTDRRHGSSSEASETPPHIHSGPSPQLEQGRSPSERSTRKTHAEVEISGILSDAKSTESIANDLNCPGPNLPSTERSSTRGSLATQDTRQDSSIAPVTTLIPDCASRSADAGSRVSNHKMGDKGMLDVTTSWNIPAVSGELLGIDRHITNAVITLLEEGCTLPFIARYRKEKTGDLEVEKLRKIASTNEELKAVQSKIVSVHTAISKQGKMTDSVAAALSHAQCMAEVEHLYAPFKPEHKGSLAAVARSRGLGEQAELILEGRPVQIRALIRPQEKGVSTEAEVEKGLQHVIADVISKDKEVMDMVRSLCRTTNVRIESKKKVKKEKENDAKQKPGQSEKFEQYFDFGQNAEFIKPHQVLAINRGEEKKVLTFMVSIPDVVMHHFKSLASSKWISQHTPPAMRKIIQAGIDDAYGRLIHSQMCRSIRSGLTKMAEEASIEVFAANLRQLLLVPPLKGKKVLGVDPGFQNGCKTAVVSETGSILETCVVYMHDNSLDKHREARKVVDLLTRHQCEIIAIGNGVACRETEKCISDMIQQNRFYPLNVSYCIVNEDGASIFSVSTLAAKEMPDLDPTLRGAVSIARRLQDPLAELVKIEPKHIGVGMYQHDIAKGHLKKSLDSVIEECVSLVGVDLNTCSECLLRHVAGLGEKKAKKILEWRERNGPFLSRSQLLDIRGLGPKTYNQCAGFVRVLHGVSTQCKQEQQPEKEEEEAPPAGASKGRKRKATTAGTKSKIKTKGEATPNPLDMTPIHPESYPAAEKFIRMVKVNLEDIGQPHFINSVNSFIKSVSESKLAADLEVGLPTLKLMTEALTRPVSYDLREELEKPVFKKGVRSVDDVNINATLSGCVRNVCHFGAFVDVGVGKDALIHSSQMWNLPPGRALRIGDQVEVKVLSVEKERGRMGLRLQKLISKV